MNKYQKWTVIFCLCFSASVIFGQVAKSFFTYAPITGWLLGCIFLVLATITALKAWTTK
jgi:hypothetical protein